MSTGSKPVGSARPFLQRRQSQQQQHRQRRCVSAYRLLSLDLYDLSRPGGGGAGGGVSGVVDLDVDLLLMMARRLTAGNSDEEDPDGDGQDPDLGRSADYRGGVRAPTTRVGATATIAAASASASASRDAVLGDWNQANYLTACARLGVKPSQRFLHCLTGATVELRGQHLGQGGAAACAASLRNNANLRSLIFEANGLRSPGCQHLVPIVVDNPFLTELRLTDNAIELSGLSRLTEALARNETVTILDLSGNRFEEKCGLALRRLLEENKTIQELHVAHNNFRERGIIAIAYGLATNQTLKLIDVSWNHIRLSGAVCLCDSLRVNRALETALFGWNGLYLEGCKSLARSLSANATLTRLDISCNRIDIKCLEFLFKGLKANATLKCLKISQNPLTAHNIKVFLSKVEEMRFCIEELDVTGLTVDPQSLTIADRVSRSRRFKVIYGVLLKQESKAEEDDMFMNDDPMMVLIEFMKLKNMRLLDLFMSLDADGSKSLSHKEFKDGLAAVGVPMSPLCVQRLVRVLDRDGDGEIDYSELISGQREHRRRLMKIQVQERNVPYEETELGSINLKLRRLLARRERAAKEAKAAEVAAASAASAATAAASTAAKKPSLPAPEILDVALRMLDERKAAAALQPPQLHQRVGDSA